MKINRYRFSTTFFRLLLCGLMVIVAPSSWSQTASAQHSKISANKHAQPSKKPRLKKPKKPTSDAQKNIADDETVAPKIVHSHDTAALDAHLSAGYLAYQQADFNSARQRYRQALNLDANNRDAVLGLALVAQNQGQEAAALHYFRQAWALDPSDPVANAGLALFSRSDGDGTESRLKQLLAQTPSAGLYFALGNHFAAQSRWADARLSFANALSLEPTNAQLNLSAAVSFDHLQNIALAQHHYQQALLLDGASHASFDHAKIQLRLEQLAQP
jgi:Tfp pilus assembly protein PilF